MVYDRPIFTQSAAETEGIGQELAHTLLVAGEKGSGGPRTICLYGELGSGKTTFVRGFARGLGIATRLLSPTFIIVRRYPIAKQSGFLHHIDLYRIAGEKELIELGLPETLADPDSLVLVEWAEKMGNLLPEHRIDVHFKVFEDGKRKIWKKMQS